LTNVCLDAILCGAMSERAAFENLMDIFDDVVTKAGSVHSTAYDFGTGVPLYKTEIHTIRAIGENPRINVTRLAEHMGVTKGAVSQTVNKLARKGLVRKRHAHDNAREILLELTDLGWTGFHNHEQFHMDVLDVVHEYFGDRLKPNLERLTAAVTDLNSILDRYEQRRKAN
jgi:DNA-binding MarR family transcriptional regulator